MALIEDRPAFELATDLRLAAAVVSAHGELDAAAAHRLQDEVVTLVDGGSERVVIDLSDSTFTDSAGLGAFVTAVQHVRDRGGAVQVAASSPDVLRLLEIGGVTHLVPVIVDLDHLGG